MKKDIKKIYNCRHQKGGAVPCETCKKGRKNKTYKTEFSTHCAKCGKVVTQGTVEAVPENPEYKETWISEHENCQVNPNQSQQNKEKQDLIKKSKEMGEKVRQELPKIREQVEEARKVVTEKQKTCWKQEIPDVLVSKGKNSITLSISCGNYGAYFSATHEGYFSKKASEDFEKQKKEQLINSFREHQRKGKEEEEKCANCGKILRHSIDKDHYYEEAISFKAEGEKIKYFCSDECWNNHGQNKQSKPKEEQTNFEQKNQDTSKNSLSENKNNKGWTIFAVITVAVILGAIIYFWARKKNKK